MPSEPTLSQSRLDELYDPPADRIQKAVTRRLTEFHRAYLAQATFFCLATGSSRGLDASPRGGPAGFVHALDENRVAFADWPGNNRIESLRNLAEDDRAAMLFLFPGLDIFMRLNGTASGSDDPELLARLGEAGRAPKSAIILHVEEALFHCGKAINRARLWREEARIERAAVPSAGAVLKGLVGVSEMSVEEIDAAYQEGVTRDLY